MSPRVPGVYGVGRVPGRGGASASGCLCQGIVRRGRRVRGWSGRGRSGVQRFRALPSFPSPPFPPFPPSPLGAFAPSCRQAAVTVGATRSPVVCLSGAATRPVRGQLVAPLEWIHALAVALPGSFHCTRSIPWTPDFARFCLAVAIQLTAISAHQSISAISGRLCASFWACIRWDLSTRRGRSVH